MMVAVQYVFLSPVQIRVVRLVKLLHVHLVVGQRMIILVPLLVLCGVGAESADLGSCFVATRKRSLVFGHLCYATLADNAEKVAAASVCWPSRLLLCCVHCGWVFGSHKSQTQNRRLVYRQHGWCACNRYICK
jgi:hypothetical protein